MTRNSQKKHDGLVVRRIDECDLPELTRLHLKAFAGYMNASLGSRYVFSFLDWFRRREEHIALCALIDQRPVGYVVGGMNGYQRRMNRELASVVAACVVMRPWVLKSTHLRRALLGRARAMLSLRRTARPESQFVSLVGIGVSPEAQGAGVGTALIRAFEDEALQRGFAEMRLSVYPSNASARRLYERMGWNALPQVNDSGAIEYVKRLGGP